MLRKMLMGGLCAMILTLSTVSFAADVFVTKDGKRYHRQECRLIQKREVTAIDEKDAIEKGLTPCKVCFKEEAKDGKAKDKKDK